MRESSFRMIRLMGTVSLLCGMLIVATKITTLARIRNNQDIIMHDSVAQLLPGIHKQVVYGIEPSGDLKILPSAEGEGPRFFAGYDANENFLGVVVEASDRGYADVISAMYAYSPDKQIVTGFKVVEMRETPGLGDRIRSDVPFLNNFKDLDATHPIAVVKHGTKKNPWEIDAISGATVSSRAVGRMLEKSTKEIAPIISKNLDRIRRGN
ncbi:MAG TPA: FMN-binding protein [Bryobacteraceae bacterium]|nr:FMN-binding protein [Bryobacteraceae bacterium]